MRQSNSTLFDATAPWQERLDRIVAMMRELSLFDDPQAMVRAYSARMQDLLPTDRRLSLSRRGLQYPSYRITRYSGWAEEINPWTQKDRLPLIDGGLLAELIYDDEPRIINDLQVDPADPAAPYLEGMRSLMALPNYDGGVALNMVIALRAEPDAFDPETLPERVWMSNLFGRATNTLVLKEELRRAYEAVNRELTYVANIQRSLLPKAFPPHTGLSLAAYYQTSTWAGGDFYDFFELPGGRWGLWIADATGHGTPAAVLMAITHALTHAYPGPPDAPEALLTHVNRRLAERYTGDNGAFVTAFYGIYDPDSRELSYASAGHNPPRLKRCEDGTLAALDAVGGFPLGLFADYEYRQATLTLRPGDQIVFYTDGITEAADSSSRLFGVERLDRVITECHEDADRLIRAILEAIDRFTDGRPADDDRTLLVAKVR